MSEWQKIARFLLVGVFNTACGYALFATLHYLIDLTYNLANAISYLIMISVAFILYERLVFGKGDGPRGQAIGFYILSAALAFSVNLGLLNLAVWTGLPVWFSQIVAMGSYSVVFYLCNRLLVFRKKSGKLQQDRSV